MSNQRDEATENVVSINEALTESFRRGQGVVHLARGMSDSQVLALIKLAAAAGKPFTVIPQAG